MERGNADSINRCGDTLIKSSWEKGDVFTKTSRSEASSRISYHKG